MQVYIEYVLADNFIIDAILLRLTYKSAGVKSARLLRFLSAAVGTAVAVLLPLFKLPKIVSVIIKILLAFSMVIIGGKFSSVKKYLFSVLLFVGFTLLSGGAVYGVFYLAGVKVIDFINLRYDSVLPVGVMVLIVYAFSVAGSKVAGELIKNKTIYPFFKKCVINAGGVKYKINGYVDSGNMLKDDKSGLPIVVISKKASQNLIKAAALRAPAGMLKIETVGGEDELYLYKIDSLTVLSDGNSRVYYGVLAAAGKADFSGGGYDLLLNPAMF